MVKGIPPLSGGKPRAHCWPTPSLALCLRPHLPPLLNRWRWNVPMPSMKNFGPRGLDHHAGRRPGDGMPSAYHQPVRGEGEGLHWFLNGKRFELDGEHVRLEPGSHRLVLVDQQGRRDVRKIVVQQARRSVTR